MAGMAGWFLAAYLGAQTADVTTTLVAFQRIPQGHEAGLLLPNQPTGIVLMKAVTTTGTVLLAEALKRHGHPKLTIFIYAANAAMAGFAAVHNAQVIHTYGSHP